MIQWLDQLTEKVKKGIGLSLGEGFEILRRKKAQNKELRAEQDKGIFKPQYSTETIPEKQKQKTYLDYALTLIKSEEPLFYHILSLRMYPEFRGPSGISRLSKELSRRLKTDITVAEVARQEKQAVSYVKQKIEHLKKVGIPLFQSA
jgi:hypothetical protein